MAMDDLIRRGDLFVSRDWENCTCPAQVIAKAPAVDAVRVVRCKDCKWFYNGYDMRCCTNHTGLALIKPDGSSFCSYGERRADHE